MKTLRKTIGGIPKGSVAHEKDRAAEKYDPSEGKLRQEITASNEYTVFVRHEPSVPWYRKLQNDLMRGDGKGFCKTCESNSSFFLKKKNLKAANISNRFDTNI